MNRWLVGFCWGGGGREKEKRKSGRRFSFAATAITRKGEGEGGGEKKEKKKEAIRNICTKSFLPTRAHRSRKGRKDKKKGGK